MPLGTFRCRWILCLAFAAGVGPSFADEIKMAEVEALAKLPVREIFEGAPVEELSGETYWKTVRGSKKPVVVMFYSNEDKDSQNLATLVRYIASDYSGSARPRIANARGSPEKW